MKIFFGFVVIALIGSGICDDVPKEVDSNKEYLPPADSTKEYLPPADSGKEYLPPGVNGEANVDGAHGELGVYGQEAPENEIVDNTTEKQSQDAVTTTLTSIPHIENGDLASATENNEIQPSYSLETDGYHYRAPKSRRFYY